MPGPTVVPRPAVPRVLAGRPLRWGAAALAVAAALAAAAAGRFAPAPAVAQETDARETNAAAAVRTPTALLPGGALTYFRWAGTDADGAAFEQTAAHAALVESGLFPAIRQSFAAAMGAAEEEESGVEIPPAARRASELMSAAWRKGVAAAISVAPEGPPLPNLTLVLPGAAAEGKALLAALTEDQRATLRLREVEIEGVTVTVGNPPGVPGFVPFGVWTVGPHLVATIGPGSVEAAVAVTAGSAPGLNDHRLAAETAPGAFTEGWIDFAAITDLFAETPAYEAPWRESGRVTVGDWFAATGLDAVDHYRGAARTDGPTIVTGDAWILRGEPRGLFAALDPAPMTLGDLPPLPAGVVSFDAGSFDVAAFYDALLAAAADAADLLPPDSPPRRAFENAADLVPQLAGFDVRAELLEPLGTVACLYADPYDGGFLAFSGLGTVAALAVDDAPALRKTLGTQLDRALANLPPDAAGNVAVSRADRAGVEIVTVSVAGFFRPSFAVTDDWLVIALGPQSVAAFLLRADGTLPVWEPTGEWAEPFAEVPEEFTLLTATDPRPGALLLNSLVGAGLPFIDQAAAGNWLDGPGLGGGVATAPAAAPRGGSALLPPAELVVAPLFPNVAWATNTGTA